MRLIQGRLRIWAQLEKIWEQVIDHYDVPLDVILYDTTNFYTYLDVRTASWFYRPEGSCVYPLFTIRAEAND